MNCSVKQIIYGGGRHGISPPIVGVTMDESFVPRDRYVLRKAMNFSFLKTCNNFNHDKMLKYTPFRLKEGAVPFCGEPGRWRHCRSSQMRGGGGGSAAARKNAAAPGAKGTMGNPRYVYDSSVYSKYKRLAAKNRNYNDKSFGGDENHGSYTALMHVRRF